MSKFFSAEAFLLDASDLLNLTAPQSIFNEGRIDRGADAVGVESAYRHAIATSNYGWAFRATARVLRQTP